MKTRLPLSLAALALTFCLTAEVVQAGPRHNDCPNEGGHRIRAAHHKQHGHLQAMHCMHRARHDDHACTRGRANCLAAQHAASEPWYGNYYHVMWGEPVALVVPPTAELQTHWNWGVAQTAITPIWHQYTRAYPGP